MTCVGRGVTVECCGTVRCGTCIERTFFLSLSSRLAFLITIVLRLRFMS